MQSFKEILIGNWTFEDGKQYIDFKTNGLSSTGGDTKPYTITPLGNDTFILNVPVLLSKWIVTSYNPNEILVQDYLDQSEKYTLKRLLD